MEDVDLGISELVEFLDQQPHTPGTNLRLGLSEEFFTLLVIPTHMVLFTPQCQIVRKCKVRNWPQVSVLGFSLEM